MRFNVVWNEDGYLMHRGGVDPRPSLIEADSHEILYADSHNPYPLGIIFTKGDETVATLFQLPLAVIPVPEQSVDDSNIPF